MAGRTVSLVVCDPAGEVLGEVEPFEVDTPWWQDVEPIAARFPALHVLRLLRGTPRPGGVTGGAVRYLAEAPGDAAALALVPCPEVLDEQPLRMPWARPGGPSADLEWAAGIVEPTGLPVQHRTWNLSCIWSMPTREGEVWLKCVPGFLAHEGAVLRLLSGAGTPELMAADGHRLLLAELPGTDGYHASEAEQQRLVDCLVELQRSAARRTSEFLQAGVPDRRWPALVAELAAVVSRRAPGDGHLWRLLDNADRLTAAVDECGLTATLVHGDAHAGNARIGVDPPIWFDWGDSGIGHPLLDLAVLSRLPDGERASLEPHWMAAWAQAEPGSDPERAWRLVRPLAVLRGAAVYQAFLDAIEPSERVYHLGDVMPALEAASALVAAGTAEP